MNDDIGLLLYIGALVLAVFIGWFIAWLIDHD